MKKMMGSFEIAFLAIVTIGALLIIVWGGGSLTSAPRPRIAVRHLQERQLRLGTASAFSPLAPGAGQWEGPFAWPAVAVHLALLRTGQVLLVDRQLDDGGIPTQLWDPVTGAFIPVPNSFSNMFCGGHAVLADGRLLAVGGHVDDFVGIPDATLFDPVTRLWAPAGPMAFARWYPTATTLADGRVLAVSGSQTGPGDNVTIPEIYDPATDSWTQLPNASRFLPLYPFMFVLPDGRVLQAGSDEAPTDTWALDVSTQTWTAIDPLLLDAGSVAMYLPGKIIKSGSSGDVDLPSTPAVANTYVLDMNTASPRWRRSAPMNFPRAHHNLTLLPDGTVLVTGGEGATDGFDETQAVFEAEIWSPQTGIWTTMARMQVPRLYHSTALLLPDGRVLVAGGGRWSLGTDEPSAEIYSPPYLFWGSRPKVTSAPAAIQYANNFVVQTPDSSTIASVTLLRPGAVSHAYNQDQRFLKLSFSRTDEGVKVMAPASANLAPPGYYMLFIVNSKGVPSVARFVQVQ